jgi:hypothetical protein
LALRTIPFITEDEGDAAGLLPGRQGSCQSLRRTDPPCEAAPVIDIDECVEAPGTTIPALSGVEDEFFSIKPRKCPRKYSVKSNVSVPSRESPRVTARRGCCHPPASHARMPILPSGGHKAQHMVPSLTRCLEPVIHQFHRGETPGAIRPAAMTHVIFAMIRDRFGTEDPNGTVRQSWKVREIRFHCGR